MIEIKSVPVEVEQSPLFAITDDEGNRREFTAPKGNFPTEFALQYLDVVDKLGPDSGIIWLIENGVEGEGNAWAALQRVKGLDGTAFAQVTSALLKKVMGPVDGPKGNLKAV